jgi:hypothetical protein
MLSLVLTLGLVSLLTLQDSVAWTIYTMFLRASFATDATASTSRQADEKAQLSVQWICGLF